MRGEPLSLAMLISGILEALDPASVMHEFDETGPTLHDFVDLFIDTPIAEATAALHVVATLTDDDLLAARIRREVATRRHPLPLDIAELGSLSVTRAVRMVTPGDKGEDILLELSGPGIRHATLVTYVDHSYGSLLKDAFPTPRTMDELIAEMRVTAEQDGYRPAFPEVSLADARAMLDGALTAYATLDHGLPAEETWPMMRPLLRFMLRSLPEGGTGYPTGDPATFRTYADDLEEWDEEESDFAHEFVMSDAAAAIDASALLVHQLAHELTAFAFGELAEDLVWRAEEVEVLMTSFLPVVLPDDAEAFAAAPEIVEAFIGFCHENGPDHAIPARVTRIALQAVARLTGTFLALRTDPDVIRERAALEHDSPMAFGDQPPVVRLIAADIVGPLEDLTVEPLPDEAIDLSGIPDGIRDRVRSVAALAEAGLERLYAASPLAVELRTTCRRLIALTVEADPGLYGGRTRDTTTAAALVWIVGKANEVLAVPGAPDVKELMEVMGVRTPPAQRGHALLDAVGGHTTAWGGVSLGRQDLLTSERRSWVRAWLDG